MALVSTQSLTEMITTNYFLGCKGGLCMGLTTLPPSCADCLEILGNSAFWIPKNLSRPFQG
jgi:hypothetical protein